MAKKVEPRVPVKRPAATRGNRLVGPSKVAQVADAAMRGGRKK
jgi:hypothetical protein